MPTLTNAESADASDRFVLSTWEWSSWLSLPAWSGAPWCSPTIMVGGGVVGLAFVSPI
jgi:hypothetical protein